MQTALVFLTHIWTHDIETEFEKIQETDCLATWLAIDSRTPASSSLRKRYERSHTFDLAVLCQLGYPTIPTHSLKGHSHFLALDFFLQHPKYEFYWFVENDVRYAGDWGTFFSSYACFNHDMVTAHLRWFAQEPEWIWWRTFGHRTKIIPPSAEWIRSFNVIYRLSRSALQFLHEELPTGWHGHHEVLVATVLHRYGFSLLDLGGAGPFTPPTLTKTVYTSCTSNRGELNDRNTTMRYRPEHSVLEHLPNMLYHPVKSADLRSSFALPGSDLFSTCAHQLSANDRGAPQTALCDHPLTIEIRTRHRSKIWGALG